jgi:alginate O-acetyltransferase complex protein AlgJ
MALMARPRRLLGVLMLAVIAIPGVSMPFQRTRIYSAAENRTLAASPAWPQAQAWASWPRHVDLYLGDHFAFREALAKIGNRTFGRVIAPGTPPLVLDGGDDRTFLFEGLLASTGHEVDAEGAADYANFVCDMAGRLRAMRVRLVVSIAPSPADIYPDDTPDVALPVYNPTNYDLVMGGLRGCGVPAVDLRPPLRAAKGLGQLYRRTDTHWTPLAGLIAYNRVVAAMGRPDFAMPLAGVRWTPATLMDGDLPRLAGRAPIPEMVMNPDILQLPEWVCRTTLSGFQAKLAPLSLSTGRSGPTVLIIGDSFTASYFPPYFAHFVSRVVWANQEDCRFDWNIVNSVKPDFVLLMPTERLARCPGRGRPANYASQPRGDSQ